MGWVGGRTRRSREGGREVGREGGRKKRKERTVKVMCGCARRFHLYIPALVIWFFLSSSEWRVGSIDDDACFFHLLVIFFSCSCYWQIKLLLVRTVFHLHTHMYIYRRRPGRRRMTFGLRVTRCITCAVCLVLMWFMPLLPPSLYCSLCLHQSFSTPPSLPPSLPSSLPPLTYSGCDERNQTTSSLLPHSLK
jgi:hypothetical protein